MLYLIIILVSILLTAAANLAFLIPHTATVAFTVLLNVTLAAIAIFAADGIIAFIIRRLTPSKWYSHGKKIFKVTKKERNFYRKIKIKRWKDAVPELGFFTGFHKSDLQSTSDEKYLSRFIIEANYGVVIHIANAIFGFIIMFLPFCSSAGIWIPVFAVNFILSILPVFVLRYIGYTLQGLYERAETDKQKHPATR